MYLKYFHISMKLLTVLLIKLTFCYHCSVEKWQKFPKVFFPYFRLAEHQEKITACLQDDFNTVGMMQSVFDIVSHMNGCFAKVCLYPSVLC